MFELVMCQRDNLGKPIEGRKMYFCSEKASEVADFFHRNNVRPRKRKRVKKNRKNKK
jgi:hypothetical protein